MFNRSRRKGLKQAVDQATDVEMRDLLGQVSIRHNRLAQLEAELVETRAELELFERRLDDELGNLKHTLSVLRAKLSHARRSAEWKAQWGDRAGSEDIPEDVVEQFQKKWRPRRTPVTPDLEISLDDQSKAKLKTVFRALAKRFHPDLVMDPDEKRRRENIMSEVNQAYAAKDLKALEKLLEKPDVIGGEPVRTREDELDHLRKEILRLDTVIEALEKTLLDLVNSSTVKLMLDVTMAKNERRDLLAEMAADYRTEISRVESELASLL
jgi:predicted  nucleic acid-binding Zn-ribbon protein